MSAAQSFALRPAQFVESTSEDLTGRVVDVFRGRF